MLKDRVLTYQDILAIGPEDNPSVYIPLDWEGHLSEVMLHTEISLKARNWVISQFFNPHYCRTYALDCIVQAATNNGVSSMGKMADFTTRLRAAIDDPTALASLHEEILAENADAWNAYMQDRSAEKAAYARLICALKWASAGDWTLAKMYMDIAILDVLIVSDTTMCNEKVLAILDIHP